MRILRYTTAAIIALSAGLANAQSDELTGDVKLACEALLCLSSGVRPSECSSSLSRYFSISHRKLSDTISARKDFLSLCPASSEDANMRSLTDAIARGAGRCDAAQLNSALRREVEKEVCDSRYGRYECRIELVTIISNSKPAYCVAYDGHTYTYQVGATYVGDPMGGGHWQ